MAYDWIGHNWYFADEKYDRVFVCNETLSVCVTLVGNGIDKPKDIALDPHEGVIKGRGG